MKFKICFVVMTLVFAMMPAVKVEAAGGAFGGGDGSIGDPYQIEDCLDLQAIPNTTTAYFILNNDIDCSATTGWNAGAGFSPIGSFRGHLDGQGYVIKDLFINRSGSAYVGIFNFILDGTVQNLGLVDVDITGSSYAGSLAGCIEDLAAAPSTISKVYTTGVVSGGGYTGGVAGCIDGGTTVSDSYSWVDVTGTGYAGGFAGYADNSTLSRNYSAGTVTAPLRQGFAVGSGSTVTGVYFDSTTAGTSNGIGTARTTAQMMTQSTFTGWTFTVLGNGTIGNWIMAGYPHLQHEHREAIDSVYELQLVNVDLDGDYTLEENIEFDEDTKDLWNAAVGFDPIGTSGAPFTGTFDGQGNIISGLFIDRVGSDDIGLFARVSGAGAIVENLGLEGVYITGDSTVGALAGAVVSSTISQVYATGTLEGDFTTGGLVGVVTGGTGIIQDSYSMVDVYTVSSKSGGLVGSSHTSATIIRSYATGAMTGSSTTSGGLVGENLATVTNSFYDSTTTGRSDTGSGTPKTTAQMMTESTFTDAGWDFDTVWADTVVSYPSLIVFGDVTAPRVLNISSDTVNGYYNAGDVIDIDVTFSEAVTSTGNVTVTLETGDTDRTCTFAVTSATSGTCNYTVQAGDVSSDLTVSSVAGTIADNSANVIPMSNFTPITNLAANENIIIDTTAPTVTITSPTVASGASTGLGTLRMVVTFSQDVTGFAESDVVVTNATTGNFGTVTANTQFSFDVISNNSGAVTVSVPAAVAIDPAGNDNSAATSYSFTRTIGSGGGGGSSSKSKKVVKEEAKEVANQATETSKKDFLFDDVEGHFAAEAIQRLYEKGIVSGRSESKYAPDEFLNRVEALKIIMLSMNYPLEKDLKTMEKYKDVETDEWYSTFVATATGGRIINGYSDGGFHPADEVTRAEVLKMLLTTMGTELKNPKGAPFTDVDTQDWHKVFIDQAYILGIVKGRTPTVFAPDEPMTRGEIAVMVDRSMQITEGY